MEIEVPSASTSKNDTWEIDRSKIKLGSEIGNGAYGKILQAEANIGKKSGATTVAVKMLKGMYLFCFISSMYLPISVIVNIPIFFLKDQNFGKSSSPLRSEDEIRMVLLLNLWEDLVNIF